MRTIKIALLFILIFPSIFAQESIITRNSFLSANFLQVKESANFGMVFKGPGFNYGMTWNCVTEERIFSYEYELGVGILLSREIPALGFYLKPADLAYLFKIRINGAELFVGPAFSLEYNYNLYPDLQSGFDYWFTNAGLGVRALYDFNRGDNSFHLKFSTSLAGLTSRQQEYRDPYFYDLGVGHAISHLNQDLSFGSFNSFNTTSLEILWKSRPDSRYAVGYVFKFSGYFREPEITMLNHSIKLIINKKQK